MADSAFLKGAMELYQGEVIGEVIFYALLRTARTTISVTSWLHCCSWKARPKHA